MNGKYAPKKSHKRSFKNTICLWHFTYIYIMSFVLIIITFCKNIKAMTISFKNSLNFKISAQEYQAFISENLQNKCVIRYFAALKVEKKAKRAQ